MHDTHYDVLKITPDAPIEVVRAAYRALSQKYHPDRHPADPQAAESMLLLNAAYEVLSDSDRRREYDEALRSEVSESRRAPLRPGESGYQWPVNRGRDESDESRLAQTFSHLRRHVVLYGFAIVVASAAVVSAGVHLQRTKDRPEPIVPSADAIRLSGRQQEPATLSAREMWPAPAPLPPREPGAAPSKSTQPAPKAMASLSAPARGAVAPKASPAPNHHKAKAAGTADTEDEALLSASDFMRPPTAPNGEHWPAASGYIPGYEKLNADGLSQLIIDNSKNDFDVFVKLVSMADSEPKTVRTLYLAAHDQFTLHRLRTGTYEIRYEALNTGMFLRSGMFALEESAIGNGTRYSTVALALQKTANDSTDTYALTEEEFGE